MLTRKSAMKHVRQCVDYYEFTSQSEFKPGILPTKQDVLERLIYEDRWRQQIPLLKNCLRFGFIAMCIA